MKSLTLLALAGALLLGGCATGGQNTVASADESYTPTGTAIPRKNPQRVDMNTIVDKQSMENDRTMGNNNLDGRR